MKQALGLVKLNLGVSALLCCIPACSKCSLRTDGLQQSSWILTGSKPVQSTSDVGSSNSSSAERRSSAMQLRRDHIILPGDQPHLSVRVYRRMTLTQGASAVGIVVVFEYLSTADNHHAN